MPGINDLPEDVQPLATTLMLASAQDNLSVANSLMETYRRERDRALAELCLIRDEISDLCDAPSVPNPVYILRALYPSGSAINQRMKASE